MFASISRGSSRVRKTYICSSCLCNAVVQSSVKSSIVKSSIIPVSNFNAPPFSTTSRNAQAEAATADVPASEPSDSKPAGEFTSKVSSKPVAKSPRKRSVSNSQATLKALRASLIAEDIAEGQDSVTARYGAHLMISEKSEKKKERKAGDHAKKQEENTDKKTKKGGKKTELAATDSAEIPQEEKLSKGRSVKKGANAATLRRAATKRRARERAAKEAKAKSSGAGSAENTEPAKEGLAKKSRSSLITGQPTTSRGKGAKRRPMVITRVLSGDAGSTQKETLLISRGASPDSSGVKDRLINLVQSGRLSGDERLRVIKRLRSTLLRHTIAPLPASQSLKIALLSKGQSARRTDSEDRSRSRISSPSEPPGRRGQAIIRDIGPISRPGPSRISPEYTNHEIKTIDSDELQLVPMENDGIPVPNLSYGLERVLFNPGVYQLQDPRSRVFNFDPYLQTIMPVNEFDFNALKQYVTSSRDTRLLGKALASKKKYTGSTSSMTSALAHFHFLLSQWREPNFANLSKTFPVEYTSFTRLQRGPSAVFLRYRDGVYAIDADKQYDQGTILSMLGKSMEKLLTLSTDEFERYRRANSDQISEEERNASESFHYTTMGDFFLRSQLDAYDPRLPGTGMFDLKTRAVVSIRMDTDSHEQGSGYQIKGRHGEWESFEREYCDMIRAAFLKYSLQVRMGRMDGIFVAYHNTKRIFGFQYISLEEMDYALHGTEDLKTGDQEFKLSLELLNRALDRATAKWPKQSLRMHFETRDGVTPFMYIFATPMAEEKIEKIQTTNKMKIDAFEREMLGLSNKDLTDEQRKTEWEDIRARVEEEMQDDERDTEDLLATDNARESEILEEEQDVEEEEDSQDLAAATELDVDEQYSEDVETSDHVGQKEGVALEDISDEELQQIEQELALDQKYQEGQEEQHGLIEEDVDESFEEASQEDPSLESKSNEGLDKVPEENLLDSSTEGSEEARIAGSDYPAEKAQIEGEGNSPGENPDKPDQSSTASEETSLIENKNLIAEQEATEDDLPYSNPENLLAMTLTIRNKVNGVYVERPENLTDGQKWEVEYALAEVPDVERARLLYKAAMKRRKMALTSRVDMSGEPSWNDRFLKSIKELSIKGKEWRQLQDKIEEKMPLKTLDMFRSGFGKEVRKESESAKEQGEKKA